MFNPKEGVELNALVPLPSLLDRFHPFARATRFASS